jgi:hypothetical protein
VTLLKTTEYLMREVLFTKEEEGLAESLVYDFVFDRLRAVRQEGKRSKSAGIFFYKEIIVNLFSFFYHFYTKKTCYCYNLNLDQDSNRIRIQEKYLWTDCGLCESRCEL